MKLSKLFKTLVLTTVFAISPQVIFPVQQNKAIAAEDYLSAYNSNCNSTSKSQSGACLSAIHRYCATKFNALGGISQEVGFGVLGVACFSGVYYGDVSLDTLTSYNTICNRTSDPSSGACTSAIHRYCATQFNALGGVSQEGIPGVAGVACFSGVYYGDVSLDTLTTYNTNCNRTSDPRSGACTSAIHRYCATQFNALGGVSQEGIPGVAGVACFSGVYYGDVYINPPYIGGGSGNQ